MGRYFDYSDWTFDEICNNLRERIAEAKKPLPPKVWKHYVAIVYRIGESTYTYSHGLLNSYRYSECDFKTREDAEKFLEKCGWIEKRGDNFYVEDNERRTYTDSDGNEVLCHYEIKESDYQDYEDGESHFPYTEEEKRLLSETLYNIEKARAYLRAYDYCCDQYSFGDDSYTKTLKEEMDKFEKEYTEELPEDYYDTYDD